MHKVAKKARISGEEQVVAAHRSIIKKAVIVGSTPDIMLDINMGHASLANMADTVPALSGKRTRGDTKQGDNGKSVLGGH